MRLPWFNRLFKGQRGVSLLETIIAIGILGMIGTVFTSGRTHSFRETDRTDQQVTGESLVRSQLEYIQAQNYFAPPSVPYLIPTMNDPGVYSVPPPGITPLPNYTLSVEIKEYCVSSGCYPVGEMQQITARSFRQGNFISKVSILKTNR